MENTISKILRDEINIISAGRTDTGVHAKKMFAHFDVKSKIEEENFCYLINRLLPNDIAIKAIHKVKSDSHSRVTIEGSVDSGGAGEGAPSRPPAMASAVAQETAITLKGSVEIVSEFFGTVSRPMLCHSAFSHARPPATQATA